MSKHRLAPRDALAHNLRILMRLFDYNQVALSKKSGVDQKTISNIINARTSATLDKLEDIAAAFGLNAWHMLLPNLPEEMIKGGTIDKLLNDFLAADQKGRDYISHVAEREAHYKTG